MNEQNQKSSSKHDVIVEFLEKNDVELMHLQLFLTSKGIVCVSKEEWEESEN